MGEYLVYPNMDTLMMIEVEPFFFLTSKAERERQGKKRKKKQLRIGITNGVKTHS